MRLANTWPEGVKEAIEDTENILSQVCFGDHPTDHAEI